MQPDPAVAAEYRAAGWWGDTTVGDAVAGWARERPSRDALVADGRRANWAEYHERASALARVLAGTGLPRGARAAVLLPDGVAVHVAFVAAERAGLTIVGLGHRAGGDELRHLVSLTQADALVTLAEHRGRPTSALVEMLRDAGCVLLHHVVVDDDGVPADADAATGNLEGRGYGPDDVFLINSTSGTTGMPKCVLHTQNRWMYFHQLAAAAGDMTTDDVFLSAIPAPFGFGIWTAHVTPAVLGAPTVVHERFDADAVIAAIERERVTVLACVSTQFLMMLKSPAIQRHDLSSLRCMFTGGEAVPYERAARFEDVTGARVLQFYGSNETGALSNTTMRDDREHRLQTAGRVIADMQVRLLDDAGVEITTPDTPGHPVCKGPATCLGYLDDARANAELFTADGWMRIGDLCTVDADGYLRVVGRTSDIIIRGGKNISAPAVEAEVAQHPAVAVAAAVAMPDDVFGERVCLYAELEPGATLELDALVEFLRAQGVSPEWFPERLVVLDALPRASGGKVAKGDLRADIRRRREIEAGILAADDAGARVLATVASLTDEEARGPSRLPGWSRGHVLTHLARNADGIRNMVEGAIDGEEREQYPGGVAARAANIDVGAGREARALVEDFERSHRALVDTWWRVPDDAWSRTGIWLVAGRQPITESLRTRRRELLVHWVDLGLGVAPDDLPDDYVEAELDWLRDHRATETWPDAPW